MPGFFRFGCFRLFPLRDTFSLHQPGTVDRTAHPELEARKSFPFPLSCGSEARRKPEIAGSPMPDIPRPPVHSSPDSARSPLARVGDCFGKVLVFLTAPILVVGYYAVVTFLRLLGH